MADTKIKYKYLGASSDTETFLDNLAAFASDAGLQFNRDYRILYKDKITEGFHFNLQRETITPAEDSGLTLTTPSSNGGNVVTMYVVHNGTNLYLGTNASYNYGLFATGKSIAFYVFYMQLASGDILFGFNNTLVTPVLAYGFFNGTNMLTNEDDIIIFASTCSSLGTGSTGATTTYGFTPTTSATGGAYTTYFFPENNTAYLPLNYNDKYIASNFVSILLKKTISNTDGSFIYSFKNCYAIIDGENQSKETKIFNLKGRYFIKIYGYASDDETICLEVKEAE